MHHTFNGGYIELVCGSMFSGKTEELLRRIRRAEIARKRVQLFKPRIDVRYGLERVSSHNGLAREDAVVVASAEEVLALVQPDTEVVAIDEVQFFDWRIAEVCEELADSGKRVVVAGLDQDFRGAGEHYRRQGQERFRIYGVLLDGHVAAQNGDTLWHDGRQVGVITCAMYSRLTERSMAIARVEPQIATQGLPLEVRGSLAAKAIAHSLPFDDPEKKKRTAKG